AVLTVGAFYLLAVLGVFKLRQFVVHGIQPKVPGDAAHVLNRPHSVALLLTLIGTGRFISSAPIGIAFLFYLLYLIPVLRILAPLVELRSRTFLYALATLYGLEGVYLLAQLPSLSRRELHVLLVLIALISLGWFARQSKLLQATTQRRKQQMLAIGIRVSLLLLAASLLGNIVGFVSLSQVLGMIALVGPFAASALYCGARVLTLILIVVLHTQWVRALLDPHID